jgi:hypothetical protein
VHALSQSVRQTAAKSECAFCHMASAKKDAAWSQFYPLLDTEVVNEGYP